MTYPSVNCFAGYFIRHGSSRGNPGYGEGDDQGEFHFELTWNDRLCKW